MSLSWQDIQAAYYANLHRIPQHRDLVGFMRHADLAPILLSGQRGFPASLIWREGLKQRFNISTLLEDMPRKDSETDIPFFETPIYIRFDLLHPDMNKGMHALPRLVERIVRHNNLNTGERHILVIEHVEQFRHGRCMEAFRVLLERFSNNAWFICTTHKPSSIDGSLRSRLQYLRVPLLTEEQRGWIAPNDAPCVLTNSDHLLRPLAEALKGAKQPTLAAVRQTASKLAAYSVPFEQLCSVLIEAAKNPANLACRLAKLDAQRCRAPLSVEPIVFEAALHAFIAG